MLPACGVLARLAANSTLVERQPVVESIKLARAGSRPVLFQSNLQSDVLFLLG